MESRDKRWFALSFCFITLAIILATSTQAAAQEFIYTSNFADNNISGSALNTTTGKATDVPGSPFAAGEGPVNMTHSPDGHFLYVAIKGQQIDRPCGFNNGELLSYSVDPHSGALAQVDDEILSGICSGGIALDPSGEFIYSASFPLEDPNGKVGLIDGFRISNGHLIPLPGTPFASPIAVADGQNPAIQNLVISRNGKVLYASDPNDAAGILIFDRDTTTGTLAFREAFNSGSPFGSIAITPSGKFLLAPGTNVMFQYEIGPHGELTSVPGSPFAVPAGAGPLAVSPDGEFVASAGAGISMQRETQHGRLTLVPGSPFGGAGTAAFDMTFDPSGRFVLVPGQVFKVHPETGALTKTSDFTIGGFADGITALQPCKLHDEHGRDSHGGDNKDYDNKKDGDGKDDGKHEIDCSKEEGSRGRN